MAANSETAAPRRYDDFSRQMDRLLGNLWNRANFGFETGARAWYPATSLWEDEDGYHVEMDMPGVNRENLELTLEKETLRVAASRQLPEEGRKYWHQERGHGRVERVIALPETVDSEHIDAELKDGVLTIHLTKRPEAQPRRIEVRQ